jgi:5-methylcytosine-specific restriction endonuclease McrA
MTNIITDAAEKARQRAKEWYYANREKVLEKRKQEYKENPELKKERVRKRYQENVEKMRAYDRERSKNPKRQEQLKAKRDRHYQNNKAEYIKRAREWARSHPELTLQKCNKRRATKNGIEGGHFTRQEFADLCEKFDNKCLCCGRKDVPLTADHVIPLSWKEPHSDEITNIQPLCQSCNSRKHAKHIDYRT